MKYNKTLVSSLLLAHILLFISFQTNIPFWFIFPFTFFILSILGIRFGELEMKGKLQHTMGYGIFSGLLLYFIFHIGKWMIQFIYPPLLENLLAVYSYVEPKEVWHYLILFTIIICGEELFWRGYIQPKLISLLSSKYLGISFTAGLYASVNLYAGSSIFVVASVVGGLFWGFLYMWKRNMVLNIVSHIVFDLFLIVLFPLF
jgi:uncharacterized protein